MSIWTHVNSSIRFDDFLGTSGAPDVGKVIKYDNEIWDSIIPTGSEGSLETFTWINPDKHCMASYMVCVFGDLRDYDNEDEIIKYFNIITKDKMIRDGFFTYQVEGHDIKSFVWLEDEDSFVELKR